MSFHSSQSSEFPLGGSKFPLARLRRFLEMLMLLDIGKNTGLFTELVETA